MGLTFDKSSPLSLLPSLVIVSNLTTPCTSLPREHRWFSESLSAVTPTLTTPRPTAGGSLRPLVSVPQVLGRRVEAGRGQARHLGRAQSERLPATYGDVDRR